MGFAGNEARSTVDLSDGEGLSGCDAVLSLHRINYTSSLHDGRDIATLSGWVFFPSVVYWSLLDRLAREDTYEVQQYPREGRIEHHPRKGRIEIIIPERGG